MNILILGGTIFLGRHIVNSALKKNHTITLFNRGLHNPDLFPDLEKIKGDREKDLNELNGRSFDAVIDTCGYLPGVVKKSAEFLKDLAGYYSFISSISVYKDFSEIGMNENSETAVLTDGNTETLTMENYGSLKALCEKEVTNAFGNNFSNVRSGLIVGDGDFSDRFTYWPVRIKKGGNVIIPKGKFNNVQFIDVKDLADWVVKLCENKISGVFNSTGPLEGLSLMNFAERCREITGSDAKFLEADEKILIEKNVIPYKDIPVWLPEDSAGGNYVDISKAKSAGLNIRPLEDTICDSLLYHETRGKDYKLKTGLTEELESEIIKNMK